MIYDENLSNIIHSPVRQIGARVEFFEGNTLAHSFTHNDRLKSFDVQRVGEDGKFFGFGVCQRLNVKITDVNRELDITTAHDIKITYTSGEYGAEPYPLFRVSEVHRDENTGELSITAYDVLYRAQEHTVSEISVPDVDSYSLEEFATACATLMELGFVTIGLPADDDIFELVFRTEDGFRANLEGTENIREVLNAVAEVTQTIYYVNNNEELVFRRLSDYEADSCEDITKEQYFTLSAKENRRLATICQVNDLGDEKSASAGTYKTSRNLIPYPYAMTTRTAAGVEFTDNGDGSVTLNGTATTGVQFEFVLQSAPMSFPLGSYYFHAHASDYTNITCWTKSSSGATWRDTGEGIAVSFSRELGLSFYIAIAKGKTVENVTVRPQFEVGSAATEYEIYGNKFIPMMGTTQFIRSNPFLDLRDDAQELLQKAIDKVGGFTIQQFDCSWRGNVLLEVGDKISLEQKDGLTMFSYVLDDVVDYDGSLRERTQWVYKDTGETAQKPTTLGETFKQTYAKVDRVEKEITMYVSESEEKFSTIQMSADGINSRVEGVEATLDETNNTMAALTETVSTAVTKDNLTIEVKKAMAGVGVEKVETSTGYRFDDTGLHISQEGQQMNNTLDNTGMYVKRNNTNILVANDTGVEALNVVVEDWLTIGKNSRLEDYRSSRTACFWIG